jgi:adenylate cyclase
VIDRDARHAGRTVPTGTAPVTAQGRRASVVLVDVVGSMSLSAAMSAEEWWKVVERMFTLLSEGVQRFGGWVDSFTGDGVAAVFAAEVDETGHAMPACAAALSLRDQLLAYGEELRRDRGVALSARIGINSGGVVVGCVRRTEKVVVIGYAAGLAKRIEALARPSRGPEACT